MTVGKNHQRMMQGKQVFNQKQKLLKKYLSIRVEYGFMLVQILQMQKQQVRKELEIFEI